MTTIGALDAGGAQAAGSRVADAAHLILAIRLPKCRNGSAADLAGSTVADAVNH